MEYTHQQCVHQSQLDPCLFRRNLFYCAQDVREAAHKGLVRHILEYGTVQSRGIFTSPPIPAERRLQEKRIKILTSTAETPRRRNSGVSAAG